MVARLRLHLARAFQRALPPSAPPRRPAASLADHYREKGARIGENSRINGIVDGVNPHLVVVGNHCVVGRGAALLTHCPVRGARPVTIGDCVWIGYGALVLPGVEIGACCVVGAGSVVTRSMPSQSIIAGNPARVLRRMSEEEARGLVEKLRSGRPIGRDEGAPPTTASENAAGTARERAAAAALQPERGSIRRLRAGLHRIRRLLLPRKRQIVICGYPRGGTSLLYNMVSSTIAGFVCEEFERTCLETIRANENGVSKRPLDVFVVHKLPRSNVHRKRLAVIVVIRDIRDVITSVHPNVPHDHFIGYEASYEVGATYPYSPALHYPGVGEYHETIQQILQNPDIDTILVRYEDLVDDPDGVQRVLAGRLGCRFRRRFSEFHLHSARHAYKYEGSRKAVDPSLVRENQAVSGARVGKWRSPRHAQRIRQEFSAHPELFDILQADGYEKDNAWFEARR